MTGGDQQWRNPTETIATQTGREPTSDSSWYGAWEAKVDRAKRNRDGSLTEICSFEKFIGKHMEWGLILRVESSKDVFGLG